MSWAPAVRYWMAGKRFPVCSWQVFWVTPPSPSNEWTTAESGFGYASWGVLTNSTPRHTWNDCRGMVDREKSPPGGDAGLKRSLGLTLITLYGLGNILGAGIYVLIGEVAQVLH